MLLSSGDILGQIREESYDTCLVACIVHSNDSCVNLISEYGLFSVTGSVTFKVDTDWLAVEVYNSDGVLMDKKVVRDGEFEVRNTVNVLVVVRSLDRYISLWKLDAVREDAV